MSNDIEHRAFWHQPNNILIEHYGIDNIIDMHIKAIDMENIGNIIRTAMPQPLAYKMPCPVCIKGQHYCGAICNYCKGTGYTDDVNKNPGMYYDLMNETPNTEIRMPKFIYKIKSIFFKNNES